MRGWWREGERQISKGMFNLLFFYLFVNLFIYLLFSVWETRAETLVDTIWSKMKRLVNVQVILFYNAEIKLSIFVAISDKKSSYSYSLKKFPAKLPG